jgi:hypothetical protein
MAQGLFPSVKMSGNEASEIQTQNQEITLSIWLRLDFLCVAGAFEIV